MAYDIRLEHVTKTRPLAVVRRRVSLRELPKVIPESCGLVWSALRAQQVTGAGRHVTVYLDDQINLEIGVEMNSPFAGSGEVVGSTLPIGLVASTVHFGPYDGLHRAHQAIRDWCVVQGHTLSGPNWEIYGHWLDQWNRDPSLIRTDVFYLLQ